MANLEVNNDIDKLLEISCHAIELPEKCRDLLPNHYNFKILTFNIRSHNRNFEQFLVVLKQIDIIYDILILTECWLGNDGDPILKLLDGYTLFHTTQHKLKMEVLSFM